MAPQLGPCSQDTGAQVWFHGPLLESVHEEEAVGRLLQLLEKVCFCLQAGIGLQNSQVRRHHVWFMSHCRPL